MKKVLKLTIPAKLVNEPIIYRMVTQYDLIPTILQANLGKDSTGEVILQIEGTPVNIERGFLFLQELDILVTED
ncbi:MAG: NIL domain-containing protein [Leptospiraceae bacterium]|nr:NIL domain-containing protein [Leptospiraceae bacterium]MCB1201134.1 NIL domain-containing protein [Leptospiraceae bacterium]